ncbi:spermidine synthase [Nakamurella sp. A5-74]|uniref:Spermidine synthase n=1 Tax=Nakamurella sp. A5-74 TaxID=3158264 RepID=A0AAU8DRX9_9ACTN
MKIEELDWAETEWGTISLRRRHDRVTDKLVHEVKLDDDFLMSSQFTLGEEEVARLGLAAVVGDRLRVLVGGLGLGYTAWTAIQDPRVHQLVVIEALPQVIGWHRSELFDDTRGLATDPHVQLVQDDFFDLVRSGRTEEPYDALLIDIDHAPDWHLRSDHGDFYTELGLRSAASMLLPHGVLSLWSDEPPESVFVAMLRTAFEHADAHVVTFANPLTGGESTNTVYLGRGPRGAG